MSAPACAVALAYALLASGCGVPSPPTGAGIGHVPSGGPASCPHALVVANSDYGSTSIAIVSDEGEVLSPLLISSGSASPGLSAALSGDVVLPLAAPASGEVVLIDRLNDALTWVDAVSGSVRAQMSVGTDFDANPHDYLEVSATKAYATRYGSNPSPGRVPFDGGGDVLIVDPTRGRILGSVALSFPDDGDLLPMPDRMLAVGPDVLVVLQRFTGDFMSEGDARIVAIDAQTDAIDWDVVLPGIANCSGLAIAAAPATVALTCSGRYDSSAQLQTGGLVLLDASVRPARELRRMDVAVALGETPGPSVAVSSSGVLLGVTEGNLDAGINDQAFTVALASPEPTTLLTASTAFVYGDVRCCGTTCFLADADQVGLRPWTFDGASPTLLPLIRFDDHVGLPPRYIGAF